MIFNDFGSNSYVPTNKITSVTSNDPSPSSRDALDFAWKAFSSVFKALIQKNKEVFASA